MFCTPECGVECSRERGEGGDHTDLLRLRALEPASVSVSCSLPLSLSHTQLNSVRLFLAVCAFKMIASFSLARPKIACYQ